MKKYCFLFLLHGVLANHLAGQENSEWMDREVSKHSFLVLNSVRDFDSSSALLLCIQWSDLRGVNRAVISKSNESPKAGNISGAKLKVEISLSKGKSIKRELILDETEICEDSIFSLSMLRESVSLTDIDQNGYAEFCFLYESICQMEKTPAPYGLCLYENGTTFRLSGESAVELPSGNLGGGFKTDENFVDNELFYDFAVRRWKKFVLRK